MATSAEDQSLLQKQRAGTPTDSVESSTTTGTEASRITEQPITSPVTHERSSQPTIPSGPAASAFPVGAIGDVFFDYDQFTLRNDARTTLEANARWLKSRNGVKVLIEGHCDERGTSAYNLVLGERRADSVKHYLQDLGVRASQVHVTSFGKEKPFCTEHREVCWQQNRRAHFVVH